MSPTHSAAPALATFPKPQPQALPDRKPVTSEQIEPAHAAPRCKHLKVNGVRCGSPALSGEKFCYYHDRFHRYTNDDYPCLEDANAVAYMINRIVRGVSTGFMDLRQATVLLYAAQNMIPLLKHLHLEPTKEELAGSEDGEQLGPPSALAMK
jgi:hypothetical protein